MKEWIILYLKKRLVEKLLIFICPITNCTLFFVRYIKFVVISENEQNSFRNLSLRRHEVLWTTNRIIVLIKMNRHII